MRQRCYGRRVYSDHLRRVRAKQTAYWSGLLDDAQQQIEADDRALWGDTHESLYPENTHSSVTNTVNEPNRHHG